MNDIAFQLVNNLVFVCELAAAPLQRGVPRWVEARRQDDEARPRGLQGGEDNARIIHFFISRGVWIKALTQEMRVSEGRGGELKKGIIRPIPIPRSTSPPSKGRRGGERERE